MFRLFCSAALLAAVAVPVHADEPALLVRGTGGGLSVVATDEGEPYGIVKVGVLVWPIRCLVILPDTRYGGTRAHMENQFGQTYIVTDVPGGPDRYRPGGAGDGRCTSASSSGTLPEVPFGDFVIEPCDLPDGRLCVARELAGWAT